MKRPIEQVREELCEELASAFSAMRSHLSRAAVFTEVAGAHLHIARAHAIATALCAVELGRCADALERRSAELLREAKERG